MSSSDRGGDLPHRPYIYRDTGSHDFVMPQKVLDRLREDIYLPKIDFSKVEFSQDVTPPAMAEIARRISTIKDAMHLHSLPIDGARLHIGKAVLQRLKEVTELEADTRKYEPTVVRAWGLPVVLEETGSPDLIELRWTIRG